MLKKYKHAPAHLFINDCLYFVTGAIYLKRRLLSPELKLILIEVIKEKFNKYRWELHHWVILDNHYHVMGRSKIGTDLRKIFREIHGSTSTLIREATGAKKPMWWNYWDYCPRNERDYFIHLNYLFYNPLKHEYVENITDYQFSSFPNFLEKVGRDELVYQFRHYPEYKTLILDEGTEDDF